MSMLQILPCLAYSPGVHWPIQPPMIITIIEIRDSHFEPVLSF